MRYTGRSIFPQVQHNEDYVLGVLQEGGLLTRKQIDGARSRLNGEPGVLEVLINEGALSEVDVSRTLAAQAHMDWIDISTMIIPPQVINELYLRSVSRRPTDDEHKAIETQLAGVKDPGPPLEDVFWALLNSREFLFNH